jgi:hypothetical protein
MNRPPCEVADVVRAYRKHFGEQYDHLLDNQARRVLHAIENCRTAALGGHVDSCDQCGYSAISYNSCRNRHCPKCQGACRERWLRERSAELLPVPYFHVVFTLPQQLAPLALQNKRVVYGILFRAAAATLIEVAADEKRLGAETGFLAVLHTWGQTLQHHPHLHCVIPGGGLSPDRTRWISSRSDFFLPVKVLSRVFRGKFASLLRSAFRKGKLQFHGRLAELRGESAFSTLLDRAYKQEWVVYTKRPFGGPEQVLRYLARYTHRVAISNHRLLSVADGQVTFRWKDYAHGGKSKQMTLTACEFLRRFLLHVLPRGFVRIRHFGFLANRQRKVLLEKCRVALSAPTKPLTSALPPTETDSTLRVLLCPVCHGGRMVMVDRFPRCVAIIRVDSS